MLNETSKYALPYVVPSQAKKEITVNEAMFRIDSLANLVVQEVGLEVLPEEAEDGYVAILSSGYEGKENQVAFYNSGWHFAVPFEGMQGWHEGEGDFYVFKSGSWQKLFDNLGDVATNSSLFWKNGNAVHAESRLDGGDWVLKVSSDGANFSEVIKVISSDARVLFKTKAELYQGLECNYNEVSRAKLCNSSHKLHEIASSGGYYTLDVYNGNVQKVVLTWDCALSFAACASGQYVNMKLILQQDQYGARSVIWPENLEFLSGADPVINQQADKITVVDIWTIDGGQKWYG